MKKHPRKNSHKEQANFADKSQAYAHNHAHALFSSLGRLVNNTFSSAMTVMVMAIAISLASGFYLLTVNLQQLTGSIESSNQISLFLKKAVSDKAGQRLANKIKANEKVASVSLITKAQAFDEFKEYSGFGDVLTLLNRNPLPTVILVQPHDTLDDLRSMEALKSELNRLTSVDFVQMDMQWLQRLQTMMQILQRGGFVLTILLGFAVLFITGNSIRLELQNRQDEVLIAKLVGATNAFIRRPFLYTGFWLGFGAGFVAWFLVTIITLILQGPIERLSVQYDSAFSLQYLGFLDTLVLLATSSLLGIIGAGIVLYYQLGQIKPK